MLNLSWDRAQVPASTADMLGHAAVNCSLSGFSLSLPQAGWFPAIRARSSCRVTPWEVN